MAEGRSRPAWADVDLHAVRHNTETLCRVAAPAVLCAVVKADAYGHGAPAVARAALSAGATWLGVAIVDEGIELREAGIDAPVLVLSEVPPDAMDAALETGLTPTVCSDLAVEAAAKAAARRGTPARVHVKVDTGMHRMGVDLAEADGLVRRVVEEPALHMQGLWTHLAVADGESEEDRAFTAVQLAEFARVTDAVSVAHGRPDILHAANTAGAIAWPDARLDLVRCGLALYGESPSPWVAARLAAAGEELRPVLSLRARVSAVRVLPAGERPSYGRRRPLPERSVVATVPLGYADGVPWALFEAGFCVLIGGRRVPLAGAVTMDQIVVDCGPGATVSPGDEAVLLGTQGDEAITASEWATLAGTINYEVLCGIGSRVPRVFHGGAETS